MTEQEEVQVIAGVVANPSLEGLGRLIKIRDFSKSDMAGVEACGEPMSIDSFQGKVNGPQT
ncbi:MAG: hypothetical protein JO230_06490 [Xanthobacteraceae bacterium]|nr:hypothetical protein [Xanthobacteraceae bacterium]